MHYVNTTFDFGGDSLLEKGKYLAIIFSYFKYIFAYSNKNEVLPIYCRFSFILFYLFFLKDKLKILAVALKFLYFLKVLSLNSVFC